MVIQMDVNGRENHVVVIMLDVGKCGLKVRPVMVIDQRNGAGDFAFAGLLPVLHEVGANHVRNGLRAVVITFVARHFIQLP